MEGCLINKSKRVDSISGQVVKQEHCSGRNRLFLGVETYYYLLYAIRENRNEKTDDLCIATINENLELLITEFDIECAHQIRKPTDNG